MPDRGNSLFSPLSIGTLAIPGRVIKTATSETRATADGVAGPSLVEFYEPMAMAGTPLIITGNIYTSRDGQSTPHQMGADDDTKIAGLAELTPAVHRHGSQIFAQLSHAGRQVVPAFVGLPEAVSASDVQGADDRHPAAAAERRGDRPHRRGVRRGGAALPRGRVRRRADSRRARLSDQPVPDAVHQPPHRRLRRLAREARSGCCATSTGRSGRGRGTIFPVIVKLNGDDCTAATGRAEDARARRGRAADGGDGIDAVEVSVGHYEFGFPVVRGSFRRCLREMVDGSVRYLPPLRRLGFTATWPLLAVACDRLWPRAEGYNLRYARAFKAALSIPVICVGGLLRRAGMEAALEDGALRRDLLRPGVHRRSLPLPAPARRHAPDRAASTATPASA